MKNNDIREYQKRRLRYFARKMEEGDAYALKQVRRMVVLLKAERVVIINPLTFKPSVSYHVGGEVFGPFDLPDIPEAYTEDQQWSK